MKRILSTLNLLLLGLLVLAACNNTPSGRDRNPDKHNPQPAAGRPDRDDGKKTDAGIDPGEKLTGLIDDDVAVLMSRLYKNDPRKGYRIVNGQKIEEPSSIWFSLKKIKLFIAKIEASVSSADCKPELGIRFYYAKYPENLAPYRCLTGLDKVAGLHTIFMVPTYESEKGASIDFDFENVGSDPCKPIPYATLLKQPNRVKHGLFGVSGSKNARPEVNANGIMNIPRTENHGGLMPPPAGAGSFPTGEDQ